MLVQGLVGFIPVEQNVIHPEVPGIFRQFAQGHDTQFFQVLHAVPAPAGIVYHFTQWCPYPLQHGMKDVLLVTEVPVNGAPGNAGCPGDFFQ